MRKTQKFSAFARVEMDLGGRGPDTIREYARHRCIHQIAWKLKVLLNH